MPALCSWSAAWARLGVVWPQCLLPNAEAAAIELLRLLILSHAPQQGSQVVQGEGNLQAAAGSQILAAAGAYQDDVPSAGQDVWFVQGGGDLQHCHKGDSRASQSMQGKQVQALFPGRGQPASPCSAS